ncbi:probable DNA replication complex GINS protein PSF2 isoform X2 [Onthophagus taurus]|uniref:probable DNA replication complex GINS protein PSF2 isoform X2 n=1 Tax=Onthophagus taurus TaxID=166361 RepID=UPI000C1FDE2A|nr:probable DNA replication complex GINS protein PSF2 [Onthophagus taurus]
MMDPEEVEFLSEKTLITIIPTFNSNVIHLIQGDIGPFRASLPITVPLWIAINLKQQLKCKIQPPDWMNVDELERIKEEEKVSRTFIKMPSEHYMVETKILLGVAPDDIPRADEIRTMIKDIWDIRMSKIRSSVDVLIKSSGCYAAIDNLTLMEINSIRPLLPHSLDQLYRMKQSKITAESQTSGFFSANQSRITPFKLNRNSSSGSRN